MALKHADFMEVVDLTITPAGAEAQGSASVLKTDRIQLMRLVMTAGQVLPEHRVPGEITIQCLSGEITVTSGTRSARLAPCQLVALEGDAPHAVHAHVDATLLVTLLHDSAAN